MPRECKNHPDKFCDVCGNFTTKLQRRTITPSIKKIYNLYFGCLGNCHFYRVKMTGFSAKNKQYCLSNHGFTRLVKYSEELPVLIPPDDSVDSIENEADSDESVTGGAQQDTGIMFQ